MKKFVLISIAASLGCFLGGCLDMSFKEPVIVQLPPCPDGYKPLSQAFKTCPEGKQCQEVVDPADRSNKRLCVEYKPETEGGDGINCPAGYITVSNYLSKSSNVSAEESHCVLGDPDSFDEGSLQENEYFCISGVNENRYCRLVPEPDPNALISILQGQRCTAEQANPGSDTLRIHVMDIGQGDAIWIQTPGGKNVLVDGGDGGGLKTNSGPIVLDYLSFHGFEPGSTFDAVFLTHPHSDHFGGFNVIFNKDNKKNISYKLDRYIDPMDLNNPNEGGSVPASYKSWITLMKSHVTNSNNIYMPAGDVFQKGEIMPEDFFGPGITAQYITSQKSYSGDDANPASIIFKLSYAGRTFLFTGDAEAAQEADAIAVMHEGLSSHFLKVCHHGSNSSSTDVFLDTVWPESIPRNERYALISSGRVKYGGENGSYIPTQNTMNKLMARVPDMNILSTSAGDDNKEEDETFRDDNILIVVKSDGNYYACYNGTN